MSTSYAVIQNDVVTEVIPTVTSPSGVTIPIASRFSADFVRALVSIPASQDVVPGWSYVNGVFAAPTAVTTAEALAAAKASQTSLISAACSAAIYAGFNSQALGAVYSYPFQDKDQQNLTDSVLAANQAFNSGAWTSDTYYYVNSTCVMEGVVYRCALTGTTGNTEPTWPTTIGEIITDGTAQWVIWETPFWCEDTSGVWAWRYHNVKQMQRLGLDGMTWKLSCMTKNQTLATEVAACTTIEAVYKVTW